MTRQNGWRWEGKQKHTAEELAEHLIDLCSQGQSEAGIDGALERHPEAVMYYIVRFQKAGCLPSRYTNRFPPQPGQ